MIYVGGLCADGRSSDAPLPLLFNCRRRCSFGFQLPRQSRALRRGSVVVVVEKVQHVAGYNTRQWGLDTLTNRVTARGWLNWYRRRTRSRSKGPRFEPRKEHKKMSVFQDEGSNSVRKCCQFFRVKNVLLTTVCPTPMCIYAGIENDHRVSTLKTL